MNCKYCGAEFPENEEVTLCPECGKQLREETPEAEAAEIAAEETAPEAVEETVPEAAEETVPEAAEETAPEAVSETAEAAAPAKTNPKKLSIAVIALVLVAGILIGLVAAGTGSKSAVEPATEPVAEPAATAPAQEEPVYIHSTGDPADPRCKASYTVSDEQAMASADVVIATMGDKELTNGQLQAFYWQEIYMFLMNYGVSMDLDLDKGLDQQLFLGSGTGEEATSWEQFFLDGAIATWKTYQALALEGEESGYEMTEDIRETLDNMPADMEQSALSSGYDSADAMIRDRVGAGCGLESYMQYAHTDYSGRAYYYDFCGKINPTEGEVEAFFVENEDYFKENGVTKDTKYVNVRHVLLQPEGGEAGENGYPVFTDEAWEACRVKAEELYGKWQEGDRSEDSFAQLAMDNSVDGSASNGGLYTDVYVGQMVPEFDAWCFDESRAVGDHGLVKTSYGYHIMFFSAHRNWFDLAKEGLIDSIAYDKIPETAEKYTAEVDFSLVELSRIDFS